MKDSLLSDESVRKISNLQNTYEIAKTRIDLLTKNEELHEIEDEKQQLIQNISYLVGVLFLFY